MIEINDFPLASNEELFLQISQRNKEHGTTLFIYLTKKQSTDLLEFLDGIREAL